MSTITVRTQDELDTALADHGDDAGCTIIIDSPRGVWLTVEAWGSATVRASGSATVEAWGSATVEAWGSATVRASDSATVRASGSATVQASDSATVQASDSATVRASGSATVRASDSATVEAGSHVAVHLHSVTATATGGVLIDATQIATSTDVDVWADYHGCDRDDQGRILLYKAVDANLTAGHHYRPTRYPVGETVEAPDWRDDHECGGGLHASPHAGQAREYYSDAPRMLLVAVEPADLRPIISGTPKAKARRVAVLREVGLTGAELRPEEER